MGTLHVNIKTRRDAQVGIYEKITTSSSNAKTTNKTPTKSSGGSVIELYSVGGAGLLISIKETANAATDTATRFYLPPDYPIAIENVGPGCEIAAIDAP